MLIKEISRPIDKKDTKILANVIRKSPVYFETIQCFLHSKVHCIGTALLICSLSWFRSWRSLCPITFHKVRRWSDDNFWFTYRTLVNQMSHEEKVITVRMETKKITIFVIVFSDKVFHILSLMLSFSIINSKFSF